MQKTAHYRRVLWLSADPYNLEEAVTSALSLCPDVKSTKFEYRSDVDVQISDRSAAGVGVGLYITLFKEGQKAATVENGGGKISKVKPPRGEEFLKTGIMLLIENNHVAYLADGHTNDGQITALLFRFLKAKGPADTNTQFQLEPKANHAQLEKLLKRGVKSIDLGLTSFAATADHLIEGGKNSAWLAPIAAIASGFTNAMGHHRTPAEMQAASEIEVSLHLGFDGRGDKQLVSKLLGQLAQGVEENASEFRIVTKDNAVITHEKLIIKMDVTVTGDDVASDPQSAFSTLRTALKEWKAAGVFEQ